MSLLAPVRRVYHRWAMVMPLHDGRQCPDCGALVCGRDARRLHRELHMQTEQWQEWVGDTLMQIARHVGIPTIEPDREHQGELPGQGDEYGRVDLKAPEYDDDDLDEDDE